jgi:protein-tyrosine phosphatase
MTRIWERLYLGNFKDAEQLAKSNALAMTVVLSLCEEIVQQAANINYVHIPIPDSRPLPAGKFEGIMAAIRQSVQHGRLLVHCVGGSSRSPIMVAAWLHRCGYAGIDQALVEIGEVRDIQPSPVLLKSVKEHLIHENRGTARANGSRW